MSSRRRNDSSSRAEPEFDVTGVSRSGRVRKKSSKLIDYEEAEPETRKRRISATAKSPVTPTVKPLRLNLTQMQITPSTPASDQRKSPITKPEDSPTTFSKASPDFSEDQLSSQELKDESSLEEESEEENEGDSTSDEDFDTESPVESRKTAVRTPSVYLMEKSNKKRLIVQDGKVVGKAKAERKDKGQSRFTAYMLWAKEMRPKIAKENPDMDFSAVSKRLGELWASVSQTERNNLKRRALRMSGKSVSGGMISTGKPPPTPKLTAVKQTAAPSMPATPPLSAPPPSKTKKSPVTASKPVEELDDKTLALLRGMEPLDIAAHLHLLGQSLTAVGTRLQEHQGQIAVSGSWSVLLDSVLCAIGPLLCLTKKVPELDVIPAPTLVKMLENIALITPGL